VVVVLLAMLGTLAYTLVTRSAVPHQRPTSARAATHGKTPAKASPAAAKTRAATKNAAGSKGGADARGADAGTKAAAPATKRVMPRPLRVVGLGWDVLAPAVIANGSAAPSAASKFTKRGLEVALSNADDAAGIERALARGGADADGADVAVLPLSTFVTSYERLRALEPQVIWVVGWSRGREALVSKNATIFTKTAPPRGDVKVSGRPGDAATLLALFCLDLAGIDLARVKLSAPDDGGDPILSAIDRANLEAGVAPPAFALTSADASRLLPVVAVAPRALVAANGEAITALLHGWLDGVEGLRADVPAAARKVAAIEGAPETVVLLERLGQLDHAGLRDNARALGLSGRGTATVPALFQLSWRLWRGVSVLSTPSPEMVPLSTAAVARLVRAATSLPESPPPAPRPASRVLLVHPVVGPRVDSAAFATEVGLVAGIFDRSVLRVSLRSPGDAEALLASVRERFDVPGARLQAGRTVPTPRAAAAIEVLAEP